MKCALCGKDIKNVYRLNGKVYGYNCYKLELAKYKIEQQQLLNDEYAKKVLMAILVYKEKTFTRQYSVDFQKSILDQYNACKKLTGKQLTAVQNTFSKQDWLSYNIIRLELDDFPTATHKKLLAEKIIDDMFYKLQRDSENVNDMLESEPFLNILKLAHTKGCHFYKDIDEDFIYIDDNKKLDANKKDEYLEVLKVIE